MADTLPTATRVSDPGMRALYRLENRRWVKAEWKMTDGGREAKYYRLTTAGRRQLEEEQASWKRLTDVISLVLETSE